MRYIVRNWLVAAGLACLVVASAAIVVADENQSGASNTPVATDPANVTQPDSGQTTPQQAAAPVHDPQAAAQNAAEGKSPTPAANNIQSNNGAQRQNSNAASPKPSAGAATQEWPAPQRYESGRTTGSENGRSGASLGVNVVGSDDGQGIIVSRIRPGTPADRMGLRPRDRILTLNGQPVVSVEEFVSAIRGMGVGEDVQLSIDRGGDTRNIGGKLDTLRDAIAAGEGPVRNLAERAREILGRERDERVGIAAGPGVNVQAGFQDDGQSATRGSSDVDARIARLEQQIERLTHEIEQLRSSSNAASAAGQPTPSALQPATR